LFRFPFPPPRSGLLLLAVLAALSASCRSLDRFDTKGDPAFCGEIVLGPDFHAGFIQDNRNPPVLALMLELDTSQLAAMGEKTPSFPGQLSSDDKVDGLCPGEPLFKGAQLRTIPQVYHDTLSTLSFGEGHDEDFFAWVDSTCQGTMLALVSMLRNGDVELRLFKPAPLSAAKEPPAEEKPGYGLFYMNRSEHACEGF
jgi:hypothetical protein